MGYKQPNNPMKMMKSALKMHKAEKKSGMHRDSAMYMNSPMYTGHSPMEMGHESPAKKESRELKDMPIVDIEKGDAKGSPAKKYDRVVLGGNKGDKSKTKPGKKDYEGSPAKAAKPDYIDIDGDGNKSESMKDAAKDKKKGSPANQNDERSGYNYAPDASTQAARQIGKDTKGGVTGDIDKDIYDVTGATHRQVYTNPTTGKFWNAGDTASFNEDRTHGDYNYNKDFNETFRLARKDGVKTFTWRGKKFNTKMA
ncbi:hypothetical protein CMO95_02340 [Candidatus Woesearchaeota archaeon]|nr:hypothetical protein [Candidatus Woesearchaeota archaeon]|tara:strand:+ start:311 stop:1072 length:762 start_codon:yes stop_codon:yes gene_type:complete